MALAGRTSVVVAAIPPQVLIADDETRVRRGDRVTAESARGTLITADGAITLAALRGETVSFQVIVLDAPAPLEKPPLAIAVFAASSASGGSAPGDPTAAPQASLFQEFYLPVTERSRNDRRPTESLGWTPAARPADDDVRGDVPDALVPLAMATTPGSPKEAADGWQAYWVDLFVPEACAPGRYTSTLTVAGTTDDRASPSLAITVDVAAAWLPYRGASVFAYYEPERLERRIGDGASVERQLWQLLHEHHVDALPPLTSAADVDRLSAVWTGRLFTRAEGYHGPGEAIPPTVTALGAYGQLGDATPAAGLAVQAMTARLAAAKNSTLDIFLYAVDEDCDSPRAAAWKRTLAGRTLPLPVAVGQTCARAPELQAADVAVIPGPAFTRSTAGAAAAHARRAWAYNGALPQTGTLLLDADPRGLTANGWIAALADVQRWFYWETTFWDDDNRGGRGPVDPFITPVNFHNRDGDTALGDGLLVYPGRQHGKPSGRSFAFAGVFPSLRLKMLRRGIQDAGYLALAARENLPETLHVAAQALPAVLDEAPADAPASWTTPGARLRFGQARAALRALITRGDRLSDDDARQALHALAAARRESVATAPTRRQRLLRTGALAGGVALALIALGLLVRRRGRSPLGRQA